MVIFTNEILDSEKPILVENVPPLMFAGGPTNQERTVKIQEAWNTDRSVAAVTYVGVPVEKYFQTLD